MAKITFGDKIEARIELPQQIAEVPAPQVIEKVIQVVEFDYAKISPYIKELEAKIKSLQQFAIGLQNPVTQIIEKKEILPVETKVVNIVTHDKQDIERLDSELKYIYDELKSDVTAILESHKLPQVTVVDTSDEITKLNKEINKLKKQNIYLSVGLVVVTLILNLI
jgi:SMC interacting uncharacterized protein involved in chromosome segregation